MSPAPLARSLRSFAALAIALGLPCAAACESAPEETFPISAAPPSRHAALRESLTTESRRLSFKEGDWLEDLGDAPFFGLAWLSRRASAAPLPAEDAARLDQSLARARVLLGSDLLSGDLQEKVMAALGVIEHVAASKDRADVAAVDEFLDRLDHLVGALGDYLDGVGDTSWAVRTYGPTAVTALVALVHAQYALLVEGERGRDHQDR